MNKEESDLIIAEQNKSTEKILKAVAKVNSDYKELSILKDTRIAKLEKENEKLKETLTVGTTCNKGLIARNKFLEEENDKYRNMVFDKMKQIDKAKDIIKELVKGVRIISDPKVCLTDVDAFVSKAEQFLREMER